MTLLAARPARVTALPHSVDFRVRQAGLCLLMLFALSLLAGCGGEDATVTLSEAPAALDGTATAVTEPRSGTLGIRARVTYASLEQAILDNLPAVTEVDGEKQVCKRIVGIKACGTAQYDVTLTRGQELNIKSVEGFEPVHGADSVPRLGFSLPLAFSGTVGIDGRVAKALSLDELAVDGKALADVSLGLTIGPDWCPTFFATARYRWLQEPTVVWRGTLNFNLERIVDAALDKQLARLEPELNRAIDCQAFRQQLGRYWKAYSFPIELPTGQTLHLNIVPEGFAYSGVIPEADRLGVSFALRATSHVESNALEGKQRALPPLESIDYEVGDTAFTMLLRASYAELQAAAMPALAGRKFVSTTAAGTVTAEITSIAFSGRAEGIIVTLGFTASLPATRKPTRGVIYLSARPVVNADTETLSLQDIRFTRVLDNQLWSVLSSLFDTQIVKAIERASRVDIGERSRELGARLQEQLADPERTGGLAVTVPMLTVRLLEVIPEAEALAALAEIRAAIDIDIPLTVLQERIR